jgi:hypothetical protein
MRSAQSLKAFAPDSKLSGFCDVSFAPFFKDSRDFDAYRVRTGPGRENNREIICCADNPPINLSGLSRLVKVSMSWNLLVRN